MTNWRFIIGAIAGSIVLRVVGFVNNFWVLIGFVALIWLWGFLSERIPNKRKLINWGFGIFLAVALATTIGSNLYKQYVEPYTVMVRAASKRATLATDLRMALKANPHMLKSRTELVSHIQWLEDQIGERHAKRLTAIREDLSSNRISPEEAWDKTIELLEDERLHKEKSEAATSKLSDAKTSPPAKQPNLLELPRMNCHSFPEGVDKIIFPVGPTRWEGVMFPDDTKAYKIVPTQWDQIMSWNGKLSPIDTPSSKSGKGLYIPIPKNRYITQATLWVRGEGLVKAEIERE